MRRPYHDAPCTPRYAICHSRSRRDSVDYRRGVAVVNRAPTLASAGIDKKLSARSQKLAALPAEEWGSMTTDQSMITPV